jgi:hypothetical protein
MNNRPESTVENSEFQLIAFGSVSQNPPKALEKENQSKFPIYCVTHLDPFSGLL